MITARMPSRVCLVGGGLPWTPGLRRGVATAISVFLLLGPHLRAAERPASFSRDVLPVLSDACFQCHGPDEKARKAKLRLDTKEGAFRVKDGVAVIVPGKPDQSALMKRLISTDPDELMPPPKSNRKISPQQIEKIRLWIEQGASWGEHWAFEKVQPPATSASPETASGNPIDRFVRHRLEKEGLKLSPQATRSTLLRRLTLDLTGLPPTPAAVEAFLQDGSPSAYEKVVERLLSSTAFGERMAWDWLEAARYADSNGYQGDGERTMWPWRDWVVKAFNENLPFDQFTVWQIAGDQLPNAALEQKLATGFCRNHPINGEGGRIPEENRVDYVMDMAETVGTVWLGLTFNCCRCHDHKFDPLSRADYYSLFAFFNQTPVDGGGGDPQTKPTLELPTSEQSARLVAARRSVEQAANELDQLEAKLFPRPEGESADKSSAVAAEPEAARNILKLAALKRNRSQLSDLEKQFATSLPQHVAQARKLREALEERDRIDRSIVRVMVMEDMPQPRKTFVLETGLYDKKAGEITAALPAKLAPPNGEPAKTRLDLARWLVSDVNPLTARVVMNRLWQQFFGIGLVKTAEDFGVQSETPAHQELLDLLASEFMRSGWDWKRMCRLIVMSDTYRQSSDTTPELRERDPNNRWLARGPRFRMPSWMIRDQALAASGLLALRKGGPPVKPYQPEGVWEEATFGTKKYQPDTGEGLYRRSIYVFWRRIIGPTLFFDTAPRTVCTVKPLRTNSPLHALATLDDTTYVEAARAMAEHALASPDRSPSARITGLFRRLLARDPNAEEQRILLASLDRLRGEFAAAPAEAAKLLAHGKSKRDPALDVVEHAAYTAFCSVLLNMDETLTKE